MEGGVLCLKHYASEMIVSHLLGGDAAKDNARNEDHNQLVREIIQEVIDKSYSRGFEDFRKQVIGIIKGD